VSASVAHRGAIGQVGDHDAVRAGQRLRDGFSRALVADEERHAGAARGQRANDGFADPAIAARHQRVTAGKTAHVSSPFGGPLPPGGAVPAARSRAINRSSWYLPARYWSGHAAEAIHRAELDELGTFGTDEMSVDERNVVVAKVAAESTMRVVRQREAAAYEALVSRLKAVDPDWLDERDADGDSLRDILDYDGAGHYREHLLDVRAWFNGAAEPDDEDDA